MSKIIRPKFPPDHNYEGTFFDQFEVTVPSPKKYVAGMRDDFIDLVEESLAMDASSGRAPRQGRVYKQYVFSDLRYKPARRDWNLSYLLEKLKKIADFGQIRDPEIEEHPSFVVTNERPEDEYVTTRYHSVFWKEWQFEPLYTPGNFDSLLPAIASLEDIEKYLQGNDA